MAAPSSACAATSPPMTRATAASCGASTPSPATRPTASRASICAAPPRPGTANGGRLGGGGTVWDSMAYDPELNLLYIGVGNGSPWNQALSLGRAGRQSLPVLDRRDPRPTPANMSGTIRRRRARPGTSPPPSTSSSPTSTSTARSRKVLMQAPKNGFFYVIDRTNGQLISAAQLRRDELGDRRRHAHRPADRESRGALLPDRPAVHLGPRRGRRAQLASDVVRSGDRPGLHPGPGRRLPLFPRPELAAGRAGLQHRHRHGRGGDAGDRRGARRGAGRHARRADRLGSGQPARALAASSISGPWNGGLLSTAGGLVFQGSAAGDFAAFDAGNGRQLWTFPAQTGDRRRAGHLYDRRPAICRGDGRLGRRLGARARHPLRHFRAGPQRQPAARVQARRHGAAAGGAALHRRGRSIRPPTAARRRQVARRAARSTAAICGVCHGDAAVAGALVPDLRYSATLENPDAWRTRSSSTARCGRTAWSRGAG